MTQGLVNYPTMGKDLLIFINGNYQTIAYLEFMMSTRLKNRSCQYHRLGIVFSRLADNS